MSDPYLRKTVDSPYLLIPFFRRKLKYPYYWLSKARYNKWFDMSTLGGVPLDEADSKRKDSVQRLYMRDLERDGAVLHEIWRQTSRAEGDTARNYLVWLGAQQARYCAYIATPDSEDLTLREFMQSNI